VSVGKHLLGIDDAAGAKRGRTGRDSAACCAPCSNLPRTSSGSAGLWVSLTERRTQPPNVRVLIPKQTTASLGGRAPESTKQAGYFLSEAAAPAWWLAGGGAVEEGAVLVARVQGDVLFP
jgi:hypothetical protein